MKFYFTTFACITTCVFLLILFPHCKDDEGPEPAYQISVSFPGMEPRHNVYHHLDHNSRAIEIIFDEPVDSSSVTGNIHISDKDGIYDNKFDLIVSGKLVMLKFHEDFSLKQGWKYKLEISNEVGFSNGTYLQQTTEYDVRTTVGHVFKMDDSRQQRNAIVCISDIHLGDARANNAGYSWFGKNKAALESFLDTVYLQGNINSLLIQGDLFDEWVVPCEVSPFDESSSITSSKEYFEAIAAAPTNSIIIEKLNQIADFPEIDLVYVPGNHDMMISQEVLTGIMPNCTWAGDATGLGIYHPVENMVLEHGHRYDFFNTPQPLVNQGHMLPPGYFISRLYATGMVYNNPSIFKDEKMMNGSFEFNTAWTVAFLYVIHQFDMDIPDLDNNIIQMGGINGYDNAMSFNGIQDMYAANIEDFWSDTQDTNNVSTPIDVFSAILNGHYLTEAVEEEYISQSPGLAKYDVIVFGHSHEPKLKVYPSGKDYTQVYANTGSWIDEDQCDNEVRTFLSIIPGEWTGSDLDCVQLYQFNAVIDPDGQPAGFAAKLMAEENVERLK